MTTKNIPGPWYHSTTFVWGCVTDQPNGEGRKIAEVSKFGSEKEQMATARLMSMAPDLLAMLRELVERRDRATIGRPDRADGSDGRYARARALLAKADSDL